MNNKKKTIFIALLILAGGVAVTVLIFMNEPTAQRAGATKKTAMLVDVVKVQRGTFQPTIKATGTVQPARQIILSPQVSGRVIDRSQEFVPGGIVQKGEVMLQVNPADYRNTLEQRKSELQQALANMNIERGQQDVAKQDYQLMGDTLVDDLTVENRSLVLRKPQLQQAKASVEAARAGVNQARLNLQRTSIKAPFNARVVNRNANVGSQVAPGEDLGRLVGIDQYWVSVTIPLGKLPWLAFPGTKQAEGAPVQVRDQSSWPEGQYRSGYLYKKTGTLEERTRMARVLVAVPDPTGYKTDSADVPGLMLGTFVELSIRGKEIADVVRVNREYLRGDNTIWVMKDKKLRIRDVAIVFKNDQYAYIKNGLNDGEKVVKTNISTVVDGAPLRLGKPDSAETEEKIHNN